MTATEPSRETVDRFAGALVPSVDRFHLYCGRCWADARYPMARPRLYDPAHRQEVARHFFGQGWRYRGVVLCPRCARAAGTDA
jgi:hypothetical protein